jgi:DNA-binding GntR family transcriptional regulator
VNGFTPRTDEPNATDLASAAEDKIVERIHDAVIERRLPPGTKLSEAALCEAFGVRRSRIRRSLLLLATRKIVELHPNRGAFVSRPSAAEARDVFEARRSVESAVARLAAERAGPVDIATLETHLDSERDAHESRDRRRSIRLSGEFHVLLAEAARNRVLHGLVKELVGRTSLIIAMYGAAATDSCRAAEHRELLKSLREHDPAAAATIMLNHLCQIEAQLEIDGIRRDRIDLVELFSG